MRLQDYLTNFLKEEWKAEEEERQQLLQQQHAAVSPDDVQTDRI
jgi:hypothetical protein